MIALGGEGRGGWLRCVWQCEFDRFLVFRRFQRWVFAWGFVFSLLSIQHKYLRCVPIYLSTYLPTYLPTYIEASPKPPIYPPHIEPLRTTQKPIPDVHLLHLPTSIPGLSSSAPLNNADPLLYVHTYTSNKRTASRTVPVRRPVTCAPPLRSSSRAGARDAEKERVGRMAWGYER